jgi:2-phosphosulfolactate phosphatase
MTGSQTDYRIRFERGESGLRAIAADASVVVIVDVLSFCTAVDVAVARGASVRAVRPGDDTVFAEQLGAIRAVSRIELSISKPYSLSPDSLVELPAGARLILPSPNGAALIACAEQFGTTTVIAGCLRNASAIGAYIRTRSSDGTVAVVAAGERWADGSLRPALEDDLGAGAILACLDLSEASPEAKIVARTFVDERSHVAAYIRASTTGRELSGSGFGHDVERALEIDTSHTVPILGTDGFLATENMR